METNLTLYECGHIIQEIEAIAEANGGEIPDDKLELLVQAQTTSMAKLGNLCGFIKFMQSQIDLCRQEEDRVAAMRKRAERKLDSIERFLVPFVSQYRKDKGHPLTVGTHSLSTRKSEAVEIDEAGFNSDENRKNWCTEKITYSPDKSKIKEALKKGESIVGAKLVSHESLQVK